MEADKLKKMGHGTRGADNPSKVVCNALIEDSDTICNAGILAYLVVKSSSGWLSLCKI